MIYVERQHREEKEGVVQGGGGKGEGGVKKKEGRKGRDMTREEGGGTEPNDLLDSGYDKTAAPCGVTPPQLLHATSQSHQDEDPPATAAAATVALR